MAKKASKVRVINTKVDNVGEKIKIMCSGSTTIDLESLTPLQGKLKTLSDESYEKLKKSIVELGFSFPVQAWKFKNKNYIIDAHQRVATLIKMREEGFVVPKLPVVWVEAKDKNEAAKKILASASNYGEVSFDGLKDFMKEFQISMEELKSNFVFPEVSFEKFETNFFPETNEVSFQATTKVEDTQEFILAVTCNTENDLQKLFKELSDRGFACKLMM